MRKAILRLIDLISVVIIAFCIVILLNVVFTKSGSAPNVMGYSVFRVMTGSMEPNIPTNSLIVVKDVEPSTLKVDDVISFYSRDPSLQGNINTHRIIEIENDDSHLIFHTKGDANNIADQYLTLEGDIVGKVVYTSVILGTLVRLVSNPIIFVPVIIIPLAFMVIVNLRNSLKLAGDIARAEEEQAIRDAVEKIKEEKRREEELQKEVEALKQELEAKQEEI